MEFKELEFKYYANDIDLDEFVELVQPLDPQWMMVSSYDDYFTNNSDEFIRYRYHDHSGELTIKRKTNSLNNNHRVEVNLPTDGQSGRAVEAFVNLLGYKKNFSIFKTCKIAFLEKAVLVYYIVYDENLHEKQRFIEIEANEKYKWSSEQEAWDEVLKYERMLESLKITPKNRLKKSLFELFKK
jgi:adenylate cyclase class IV